MKLLKKLVILSMIVLSGCAYWAGVKDERKAAAAEVKPSKAATVYQAPASAATESSSAANNTATANVAASKMIAPITH